MPNYSDLLIHCIFLYSVPSCPLGEACGIEKILSSLS